MFVPTDAGWKMYVNEGIYQFGNVDVNEDPADGGDPVSGIYRNN